MDDSHMKYTINKEVAFRNDDGTIWSLENPEEIVSLPTTAARIFSYLLDNPGIVISRESIFEEIWDKHGLQASNNTLNQYISLIRKTLNELGCEEDVIKTIPRVGFLMMSELDTEDGTPTAAPSVATHLPAQKQKKWSGIRPVRLALFLFIASLLYCAYSIFNVTKEFALHFPIPPLYLLGHIDSCPVYTLYPSSKELQSQKMLIAEKISEKGLACIPNSKFIFQPEDQYIFGHKGRVFLTRCTYVDKAQNNFAGCKDIYIHAE